MEELYCPDCKSILNRDYGLPGVVLVCKCGKKLIKFKDRLISVEELHLRQEQEA